LQPEQQLKQEKQKNDKVQQESDQTDRSGMLRKTISQLTTNVGLTAHKSLQKAIY
jgi:hypothetical protein